MMQHIADGANYSYLALGATDFRKQQNGLVSLIALKFKLNPHSSASIFLSCNNVIIHLEYCVDTAPVIILNGTAADETEPVLYLKTTKAKATGRCTSNGFAVFKGSEESAEPTKSCPDTIKYLREQYTNRVNADNILTEDTIFSSPSAAAGFTIYASANGLIMWASKEGKTLRELESEDSSFVQIVLLFNNEHSIHV